MLQESIIDEAFDRDKALQAPALTIEDGGLSMHQQVVFGTWGGNVLKGEGLMKQWLSAHAGWIAGEHPSSIIVDGYPVEFKAFAKDLEICIQGNCIPLEQDILDAGSSDGVLCDVCQAGCFGGQEALSVMDNFDKMGLGLAVELLAYEQCSRNGCARRCRDDDKYNCEHPSGGQ